MSIGRELLIDREHSGKAVIRNYNGDDEQISLRQLHVIEVKNVMSSIFIIEYSEVLRIHPTSL